MWRGKAGTDQGTTIMDRGCGNSRRLPLQTAVDGIPREAWKREILPHLPGNAPHRFPFPLQPHNEHTQERVPTV